jgi:hypothetical protein
MRLYNLILFTITFLLIPILAILTLFQVLIIPPIYYIIKGGDYFDNYDLLVIVVTEWIADNLTL